MAASSSHSDSHSSYDDYDDFGLGAGGGGGGGSKQSNARVKKQVETRGGSHGSGTIYSTKHVRLIEARKEAGSSNAMVKRNSTTKKSDDGNLKR